MVRDDLTDRVLDGKYRLGPVIGNGAIGRVFRATQLSLDRDVAIKVLSGGYVHVPEAAARFRQEACAVSRLSHPGIVTVFDWGQEPDGLLYLAMEQLPGCDLFEIVQGEAPLPSRRIARLMSQVAKALMHAHAHGVIHRDLKPENIRVIRDPYVHSDGAELVKIYDFGIAHVAHTAAVSTHVGALVGTPYYMSPEQAHGTTVCPQSDIYACGVVMFVLATGQLPFVAESTLEIAAMHAKARPPRPRTIRPGVDPRLEKVILACLAKRPSDRPASGLALANLLDPIADSTEPHWQHSRASTRRKADRRAAAPATGPKAARKLFARRLSTVWAVTATSALMTVVTAQRWPDGWKSVETALAVTRNAFDLSRLSNLIRGTGTRFHAMAPQDAPAEWASPTRSVYEPLPSAEYEPLPSAEPAGQPNTAPPPATSTLSISVLPTAPESGLPTVPMPAPPTVPMPAPPPPCWLGPASAANASCAPETIGASVAQ